MATNIKLKVVADTSSLATANKKTQKSLETLGKTSQKSYGAWYNSIRKVNNAQANLGKDLNRTNTNMAMIGKGFGKIAAGAVAFKLLAEGIKSAVIASVDAIETQNLYNVALGDGIDQANKFVDAVSGATSLNTVNLKEAIGTYSLLAKSMGMNTEIATGLSTSMTGLALDLSSIRNIPINQVLADLRSGLLGQSETVYKYGMDVTEVGIKQEALALGITKSVRSMSQGEKMYLRASEMIRVANRDMGNGITIAGDFARTINQPSNQLKILGQQFTTLSQSIGNMFIPMLTRVLPWINAVVAGLIDLANAIATLFGYDASASMNTTQSGVESLAENADDATDAVGGTTAAMKKLQKTMLGIDELNVMQAPTESGGGGGGAGGGASILPSVTGLEYDNMFSGMTNRAQELKGQMIAFIKEVGAKFLSFYDEYIKPIVDLIKLNFTSITFTQLQTSFETVMAGVMQIANSYLPLLKSVFQTHVDAFTAHIPDILTQFNRTFGSLTTIFNQVFKTISKITSSFFDSMKTVWDANGNSMVNGMWDTMLGVWDSINTVLDLYIKPMVTTVLGFLQELWDNHLKALVERLAAFVMQLVTFFNMVYNGLIKPIIDFLVKIFAPAFKNTFQFFSDILGNIFGVVADVASGIIRIFSGIITFLTGIFTRDWKMAINGLGDSARGLKDIFIGIGRFISDVMRSIVNVLIRGVNSGIKLINKLSWTVPDWVPFIGGQKWSPNIKQIPELATGGIATGRTLSWIGEGADDEAVIPLSPEKIQKYFAPVIGNNMDSDKQYEAVYNAVKDAIGETDEPQTFNLYIDGVYSGSVEQTKRKNIRAGKVIIPVGG